jgi:hypothetical protein
MSIRDPVPGRRSSRSIFFAASQSEQLHADHHSPENDKRQSRYVAEFLASNDRVRPAMDLAAISRSNFSTRNPKAITAMAARAPQRQDHQHLWKVTDVVPGRKVAYSWKYGGHSGDSVVSFELFDEEERSACA